MIEVGCSIRRGTPLDDDAAAQPADRSIRLVSRRKA